MPQPGLFHEFPITGGEHAALGRSQVLGGVKAKGCGIPYAAHRLAAHARTGSMGRVLKDLQTVLPSQVKQRVHAAGKAGQVHRQQRRGTSRDLRRHASRVQVVVVQRYIGQHRRRAQVNDSVERGAEG